MDMEETELFAFYGSLRRGMDNYNSFKRSLEYISTKRIKGFDLYSLGSYPYAVRSNDHSASIVIELFCIHDVTARVAIHELEAGAGYVFECIEVDGMKVGIYLFERPGDDPKVKSGDWVTFYGK